jgi:hypothetical protein
VLVNPVGIIEVHVGCRFLAYCHLLLCDGAATG